MCGIAGIVAPATGFRAEWQDVLRKMSEALTHRGPDAEGYFTDGHAGLGHRRLSIIDLVTGQQPLSNEDQTVWVTFNGEIYNYLELCQQLEAKGHVFRTRSDTEVIVHAYEEWGESCVNRFRGMFAFGLWDQRRRQLFLARDRLGKKPLYYASCADGALIFGSELKALRRFPGLDWSIDLEALSDYFSLSYVPAPRTIFRAARKLPAGHYLIASAAGVVVRRYWDLTFDRQTPAAGAADRLLEQLRTAVSLRLRSDVPLGAFLSGGLDSSTIVALMSGLLETPVITSSIGFSEQAFDERPYAREVAEYFKTAHHEEVVGPSMIEMLPHLTAHFDEPFADSSVLPTYLVSKMTRRHVTVALSGDGGDENFAGYERYADCMLEDRVRDWFPEPMARPLFGFLGAVYPHLDFLPSGFRAKAFLGDVARPPWAAYFRLISAVKPEDKRLLLRPEVQTALHGYDSSVLFEDLYAAAAGAEPLSRLQYIDFKTYLAEGILTKVDRASMANSLEVRSPLLDHEVVELAASLPADAKLRGRNGKLVLKECASRLLPPRIVARRKRGFDLPVGRWLRTTLAPLVERTLLEPSAAHTLVDPTEVRRLWEEHRSGRRNHGVALWNLVVFGLWHEHFTG